jgi:hypothetical protein
MKFNLLLRYAVVSVFIFSISFAGKTIFEKEPAPLPGGDDDKPAEEVYKNIQVLKGMPKKHLHDVMNFMRASLGVGCKFCHVYTESTKTWNWESDEMEEKQTARKMITMVKQVNKDYFDGNNAVTCFSCHQGNTHTSRTPPLPQHVPDMTETPRDTNLPSAETILDTYRKSLGNIDALKSASSRVSKGTVTTFDGKQFDIEVYNGTPNKYLQVISGANGKMMKGFDGTSGWQNDQRGSGDLDGYQLEQVTVYADFAGNFDLGGKYSKIQTLGKDTVKGKTTYVVRAIIDENRNERLYFDTETGLLVRRKVFMKTIIGNVPAQTDFSDYRMVQGVMLPYEVRYSYIDPWSETYRKYSEVSLNASLDNISFTKP